MNEITITSGDFLAGGGGVTYAMNKIEGLQCKWVLNHDRIAIRTNMWNNKGIKHYWSNIYTQDERQMEPVDFMWASIECTMHSRARGGKTKKIGSYTLGYELIRYIQFQRPMVIGIENVPEFKKWSPTDEEGNPIKEKMGEEFIRWKQSIEEIDYTYSEKIMNAADYGIPTRRVRYFAFFVRNDIGIDIRWPEPTHNRKGIDGLKKWEACRKYIDLSNEGTSIFGRKLNPDVKPGHRKPLSVNTLRRIAGGIKKFHPEMYFIFQYYSNGLNVQSINNPLNTVTVKDRHVLVKLEKMQFIQDHCRTDNYNKPDEPITPQLTRQTKQLITIDGKGKENMIYNYYGREDNIDNTEKPLGTITCTQSQKSVVTSKIKFISQQNNSNGKPEANNKSIDEPLGTICSQEKNQLISAYFNSDNKPETQNQSLEQPLNAITTGTNKSALVTGNLIDAYYTSEHAVHDVDTPLPTIRTSGSLALHSLSADELDFDIKMRFLTPEELGRVSTFPEGYFTNKVLRISVKDQTKLIGNAVPPEWARIIIQPVIEDLREYLLKQKIVI